MSCQLTLLVWALSICQSKKLRTGFHSQYGTGVRECRSRRIRADRLYGTTVVHVSILAMSNSMCMCCNYKQFCICCFPFAARRSPFVWSRAFNIGRGGPPLQGVVSGTDGVLKVLAVHRSEQRRRWVLPKRWVCFCRQCVRHSRSVHYVAACLQYGSVAWCW